MVAPNGPEAARVRVDVDPLVVAGRVGEGVDALLVDQQPVAVAEMLADGGLELGAGREACVASAWLSPADRRRRTAPGRRRTTRPH